MTGSVAQIFVCGTWRAEAAAAYAEPAKLVGKLIAQAGYSLGCGPGTGIARHVIDGFRSVPTRQGKVRYFLPARAHMEAVGENVEEGADEIIQTEYDYPMRNVFQVSKSVGLVAITGEAGTLEEILPALIDYDLPVAVYEGSGRAAVALKALIDVFPEWKPNVLFSSNPDDLARFVFERIHERVD